MRDGPVQVEFSPHLSAAQYEKLLAIVQSYSVRATSDDLRDDLTKAASHWGVSVTVTLRSNLRA